jgi:hyperosmotically inducible periplasmic protein
MLGRFTRASVAVLVIALAGCAAGPTESSTGEYIDDAWITTRAKAALVAAEGVSAVRINVETFRGVVQLSGFSSSQDEIDKAVAAVRPVKGVKAVRNDIRLRTPIR